MLQKKIKNVFALVYAEFGYFSPLPLTEILTK